jgi:hypothetical protein
MFWWLIWVLIFIILIANERHSWTDVFTDGSPYPTSDRWRRRDSAGGWDLTRKLQQPKLAPEVVVVTADDFIADPDYRMEKLIKEGRLDEARKYRLDMEKISEGAGDDLGMRKYAIYGARISRRQKEINAEKAKKAYYADRPGPGEPHKEEVPAATPGVPPIWRPKSKAVPGTIEARLEKIEPKIVPVNVEKPEPPKPAIPASEPVKMTQPQPEPPKPLIPEGFTPPPPGPVKLGPVGGYQPGKSEPDKSDEGGKEIHEDTKKINPDDYNDLISFSD